MGICFHFDSFYVQSDLPPLPLYPDMLFYTSTVKKNIIFISAFLPERLNRNSDSNLNIGIKCPKVFLIAQRALITE
jgi:hypothetical protein